jgi:hypothetical protein
VGVGTTEQPVSGQGASVTGQTSKYYVFATCTFFVLDWESA